MVSVIVAIYQAEQYLRRCVDSILAQTFRDIEVILIDDGSTDASGSICDEYAKIDKRVVVFHRKKEGIAAVREFGIQNSNRLYTIFCDSDDWMEPNMLELLITKAILLNSDVVICDFWIETEQGTDRCSQHIEVLDSDYILKELDQSVSSNVWNKLIKRSLYTNHNISFKSGMQYAEDLYVLLQLFSLPLNVAYIDVPLYHYDRCSNSNSLSRNIDTSVFEESINCIEQLNCKASEKIVFNMKCFAVRSAFCDIYFKKNNQFHKSFPDVRRYLLFEGLKQPRKRVVDLSCGLSMYSETLGISYFKFIKFLSKIKRWLVV